jgi:hypothetical protein
MSDDALKALLMADDPAMRSDMAARDIAFTLEVMDRVARRRLVEGVATLMLGVIAVSALLYLVMPYVTPEIARLGMPLLPVVGILAALGVIAFTWEQMKPSLRQYGLPV